MKIIVKIVKFASDHLLNSSRNKYQEKKFGVLLNCKLIDSIIKKLQSANYKEQSDKKTKIRFSNFWQLII